MKNMIKTKIIAILFATIALIGLTITTPTLASATVIKKGTASIRGADLPNIIGTPENNIRFALWNGTVWFELPFSVNEAKVQKKFTADANGTTVASAVSADSTTISAADVFSVKIPAMVGVNASSGEWWDMALDLDLLNRLSVQLSDGADYSCIIFIYYQTSGSCLPPDYSSDYTLPLFASPVNQTQTNQTAEVTAVATSSYPIAKFGVQSFSMPQTAKMVAASQDPQVYSLQTVLEQRFENTGSNPQPTYPSPFYLPAQGQAVSGVILKIEWNDVGDPYWRALNAYINGQIVWTDNNNQGLYIAPGSSSVEKDITNKIVWWSYNNSLWVYNNASVVLTTYAGYGHWDVRAYIYVVYTAAVHFISVAANWAQYYNIQTNTQNTIDFPTALPDNTANQGGAEMVYIHAKASNDPWARYLDLYINDVFVQRWTIKYEADESFDITSYVLGASSVTIGIQLICGVGTWGIDGDITTLYRPSVAPDFDPFWTSPTNLQTLTSHAGNIYFNYAGLNNFAGTFSTETEGFGSSANPYYFYTGLTAAYPLCTGCFLVGSMQTHISITEPDGHTILPNDHYSYQGFSGSSSGSTEVNPLANMGVALLTGTSICLSVTDPALAAMLALAALVVQYSSPAPAYSVTTDSTGIEMNYNGPDYRPQSMLLKWSALWTGSGVYTVNIKTTVTMELDVGYYATIVFTDTFTVYVPISGLPTLTISASSGGANPPTNPSPSTYTCSYGSCYPVTAYPAASYYFDHWSLDGQIYSTYPTTTVTMASDHTLTAYFNPTLTISVSGSGSTSPPPGTQSYSYGSSVTVTETPSNGYAFGFWLLDSTTFYYSTSVTVTMWVSHSLTAYFFLGGGGGGCPYVATWNGTGYVLDNSILPDSEMSSGRDVKDYYKLEQPLVPTLQDTKRSIYSLKICEFEHEHDYIDQAQLLAVDHPDDVNVAVTSTGEILTYKKPASPISAKSNDGTNVLPLLNAADGKYYQGYNGSYVTLTFAATDVSAGAKLVVRADDYSIKCPIYVQVINATGQWNTVASFDTRSNWATDIINMTGLLPDAEGNLRVRLLFVSTDEIDYVGLDTTPQANIQVHEATLLSAFSSSQGDVTRLLKADDEKYAELVPGQQILLTFMLPTERNSQRTLILYAEGHYYTLP